MWGVVSRGGSCVWQARRRLRVARTNGTGDACEACLCRAFECTGAGARESGWGGATDASDFPGWRERRAPPAGGHSLWGCSDESQPLELWSSGRSGRACCVGHTPSTALHSIVSHASPRATRRHTLALAQAGPGRRRPPTSPAWRCGRARPPAHDMAALPFSGSPASS